MKLYIMRHAQRDFGIHFDRLLTTGIWQAKVTGSWFKDKKIDVVYCSPQKRARETLKEIMPYLKKNLPIKISKQVRQMSSPEEIGADAMKAYNMKVDSFEVVTKRVNSFLKKIKNVHRNKTVLIVSHKEVTRQFIKSILSKYKNVAYGKIPVRSGSIQFFDFDNKETLKKHFTNKIIYSIEKSDLIGDTYRFVESKCKKENSNNVKEFRKRMDDEERRYLKTGNDWRKLCWSMLQVGIDEGCLNKEEANKFLKKSKTTPLKVSKSIHAPAGI